MGSVGPTNWSAQWNGVLVATSSEVYNFVLTSAANGVRMWVARVGQPQGNPVINNWTNHPGHTDTATLSLQADQEYAVEVQLSEATAPVQQVQLQWSSFDTSLQDIDIATAVGLNVEGGDGLFANMVNGSLSSSWDQTGSWSVTTEDSNFWPTTDAKILLGGTDAATNLGGSYSVQFSGMATVNVSGRSVDWVVNGVDLHSSQLTAGQGYNPATNTTTATMVASPSTRSAITCASIIRIAIQISCKLVGSAKLELP